MIWRVTERKMTGRAKEPIVELEVSAEQLETLNNALSGNYPVDEADADLLLVDSLAAGAALASGDVGRRGGRL